MIFHYMMQKHANALTPNEIKKLTRIRKAIPKPDENTLMQKVITEDMANKYLDGTYNTIGGSVARAVDTKHLKTIEDYYYVLRFPICLSPSANSLSILIILLLWLLVDVRHYVRR